MLETAFAHILAFFAAIPFSSATWFVLATLAFFIWLFAKANQNSKSLRAQFKDSSTRQRADL